MTTRKVLIPGTFDPPTLGHMDLIRRAVAMFDAAEVVVFNNTAKQTMFTAEQRREMLAGACAGLPAVSVGCVTDTLMAEYFAASGACAIVKGVRGVLDFDYETQLAQISRAVNPHAETLLLPTLPEFMHISSSMVRDMIKYKHALGAFVPPFVEEYIRRVIG